MNRWILILMINLMMVNSGLAQWNNAIYLSMPNPLPIISTFKDVDFITEQIGVYSYQESVPNPNSNTQVIVKSSTDSGKTWITTSSNSNIGQSSYSIHTVRSQNTFYNIRSDQGITRIDKTSSNGLPWITTPLICNGYYRDFSAIDTAHLFLLYLNSNLTASYINKYVNGVITTKIDSFYNEKANLMSFITADTGYIATSPLQNTDNHFIYRSVSGGINWVKVFSDSLMNIRDMVFITPNIGYAVGDSGKIIKTLDAGLNWQYINLNTPVKLYSVFFINDSTGYVAGNSGVIMKTGNGGITWNQEITGTSTKIFSKIFFVNDSIGFALTGNTLYKNNQNPLLNTWNLFSNEEKVLVSPNPFSSYAIIKREKPFLNAVITFRNSLGQEVKQIDKINGELVNIDREGLTEGLYFINIREDQYSYSYKIIITDN